MVALGIPLLLAVITGIGGWATSELINLGKAQVRLTEAILGLKEKSDIADKALLDRMDRGEKALADRMDKTDDRTSLVAERLLRRLEKLDSRIDDMEKRIP